MSERITDHEVRGWVETVNLIHRTIHPYMGAGIGASLDWLEELRGNLTDLSTQMKASAEERERLRSAVDKARQALYSNVECDCRDTLTFDCWKCNLMRELNEVMGQTPPPASTAPSEAPEPDPT